MSFLAPLFLLGGLAIAAPIVFHLIRRTSRVRTVFSSVMFLRPGPPRMTRRNRIEDWLLLALRCLVLALLALAFARPFIDRPLESLPPAGGGQRWLVLLDTSASMQREGLWRSAVERVESLVAGLRLGDGLALWTFDRGANVVFDFETWDSVGPSDRRNWLRARLAGLRPGWKATWLDQALVQAADALADRGLDAVSGGGRIVLVSDLQSGSRLNGLQAHDWPSGVTVQLESIGDQTMGNAGLQVVAATPENSSSATARVVRVRVENSPDSARDQFQVGWVTETTGERDPAPVDVYVPAGHNRVVPVPAPDVGWSGERLRLWGDTASFDDVLYVIPPEPREMPVVYLGEDAGEDPADPLYYLRRAFRETARYAVRLVVARPADAPAAEVLDGAVLVVVTGRLSESLAERVREAALQGATVLLAPVDEGAAATQSGVLDTADLFMADRVPGSYGMLGELDFRHPWLAPFADARFSDFTKIRFWRYRGMDERRLAGGQVVARFEEGDPAAVEWVLGQGRVLWLASGWHPRDSQLALSSKFVPLLYSLLDLAGAPSEAAGLLEPGDDLASAFRVRGRVPAPAEVVDPRGEAMAEGLIAERPGVYRRGIGADAMRVAVNLAPAESRTAALSPDDFEALRVPLDRGTAEPEAVAAGLLKLHRAELEARQKLWRWALAGTLALVLLETSLAARTLRRGSRATPVGPESAVQRAATG